VKKIYAFSLMAFYVLLTTGMFVCIVDCSVHHTVATPTAKMDCSTMHCAKKQHGNNDCCKKHGTYLVKENIKPGYDTKISLSTAYIQQALTLRPYLKAAVYVNYSFNLTGKAPPGRTGKFISIQYHSLQI
jgi:hypothetical protein